MRLLGVELWAVLLFLEVLLWSSVASLFLFLYIVFFGASVSVVLPHALVIFSLWLGFVSIRLSIWRLARGTPRKLLALILLLVPFFVLALWYVVVLIGLSSWGRVATWPLMKVYFAQVLMLSDVVGVSLLVIMGFFISLIVFLFVVGVYIARFDWCAGASVKISILGWVLISGFGFIVFLMQFLRLYQLVDLHPQEPVSIFFFGNSSSLQQSHSAAVSPMVDAEENLESSSYQATSLPKKRNVIVIVGDALRADHMGIYGYWRPTTEHLKASAKLYQTLIAPSVRSVCSESSCGLRAIASSRPLHLFPTKPLTLHEVLRRHGYGVSLVLSGDHTNFYGLRESYGVVDSYFDATYQNSRYINDDFLVLDYLAGLAEYDGAQPLFFQFHLMSSHGLGLRHESSRSFLPYINYYSWPAKADGRRAPSDEEIPSAINYYDNGVVQFDEVSHKILNILEAKGYLKDALVVFTGDHGEMLGEKGVFGHQRRVDDEVLHIPFILQRRGYEGSNIGAWPLASQIDVAPTILAELGIRPPKVWRGVSLQSPPVPRYINFQQAQNVGIYIVAEGVVLKFWKDISTGEEFLYDIISDSGETKNIIKYFKGVDLELWRNEVIGSSVFK